MSEDFVGMGILSINIDCRQKKCRQCKDMRDVFKAEFYFLKVLPPSRERLRQAQRHQLL